MREIDLGDLERLTHAAEHRGEIVEVVVDGAAYSCCGRGWHRRDGYEQTYNGYVDNFSMDNSTEGTFMLYSLGLGTISYVIAVRFFEVLDVRAA